MPLGVHHNHAPPCGLTGCRHGESRPLPGACTYPACLWRGLDLGTRHPGQDCSCPRCALGRALPGGRGLDLMACPGLPDTASQASCLESGQEHWPWHPGYSWWYPVMAPGVGVGRVGQACARVRCSLWPQLSLEGISESWASWGMPQNKNPVLSDRQAGPGVGGAKRGLGSAPRARTGARIWWLILGRLGYWPALIEPQISSVNGSF